MTKNLIIIGAGGCAREVAWLIEDINNKSAEWNLLGYVEEYEENIGKELNGYNILGTYQWIKENSNKEIYYVCAVADPHLKQRLCQKAEELGLKAAILIHPDVKISKYNEIGEGSIICAGCIITVNAKIGKHVIISVNSTVGHDAVIGNYTTVLPNVNISGNVTIGRNGYIGTNSAIINRINIGENVILGAGAIVTKDIPSNCTAVGVPAKPIKFNK